jgi:hypothetical protein
MANYLTQSALSDDAIRTLAPSVFAVEPPASASDRYAFLPTYQVVTALRAEGFLPFSARQSRTLSADMVPYARHEIRFRHVDTLKRLHGLHVPGVHNFLQAEEFDEIALVNSHDMSSCFELYHAVYRVLCGNGLVAALPHSGCSQGFYKVRHSGDIVGNVIEGAARILSETELVQTSRDAMRSIALDESDRLEFATAAVEMLYGDGTAPITPRQLLAPRRAEDQTADLWTTFNVVQENVMRGGLRSVSANGRASRTRGINSITRDYAVNRMLWNLAEAARGVTGVLEAAQSQVAATA